MELVDLVPRELLQLGDDLVDVDGGIVRGVVVKRMGRKVRQEEEVVAGEELDELAKLVGVATGARVVAELTLPVSGQVLFEKVALYRCYGVEDALTAVLELPLADVNMALLCINGWRFGAHPQGRRASSTTLRHKRLFPRRLTSSIFWSRK